MQKHDGSIGQRVRSGRMSAVEAVETCLRRIELRDGEIGSFVQLRADEALAEAAVLDAGPPRGALHGVPFAAKDVFDTADLDTGYNSPYYRDNRPARDAAAIALLRQAGAVLLGKLSTVEFAGVGAIPGTRNPHDLQRTPGGSSAGSGAAVGAGLVPLATATQTGGSTIRPAAFCGAAGYKPTWGRISCEGVKPFSPSLDTIGFIAEDCDLLAQAALACGLSASPGSAAERSLRIGFYRTPWFGETAPETRAALDRAIQALKGAGHCVEDVDGPEGQEKLNEWQDDIMFGEGQFSLRVEFLSDPDLAHPGVRKLVNNDKQISPARLREALDEVAALRPQFDRDLQGYDAWLTPSVPGEAPLIEDGNGLATFNRLFTALHLPCVNVAGLRSERGLPVGVQLVAQRDADLSLLDVARVLERLIRPG